MELLSLRMQMTDTDPIAMIVEIETEIVKEAEIETVTESAEIEVVTRREERQMETKS
jgi:hypothetical protein